MKGWYGNKMAHSLASKGIRSVEHSSEDHFDYGDRYIGTSFWKEFVIDNVNSMDEAIDLAIGYELAERENKLNRARDDEIEYYKEKFEKMTPEYKREVLEELEISEEQFLKDLFERYEREKHLTRFVMKKSSEDLLISDNSYEENGVYYIDLYTDYIDNEIINRMAKHRGE